MSDMKVQHNGCPSILKSLNANTTLQNNSINLYIHFICVQVSVHDKNGIFWFSTEILIDSHA